MSLSVLFFVVAVIVVLVVACYGASKIEQPFAGILQLLFALIAAYLIAHKFHIF